MNTKRINVLVWVIILTAAGIVFAGLGSDSSTPIFTADTRTSANPMPVTGNLTISGTPSIRNLTAANDTVTALINSNQTFGSQALMDSTNNTTITIVNGATVYAKSIDLQSLSPKPNWMCLSMNCSSTAARIETVRMYQGNAAPTAEGAADGNWTQTANSAGTVQDVVTSWSTNNTNQAFAISPVSKRYIRAVFINGGTANDTCTGSFDWFGSNAN
jgi:hypothetical protein